MIVLKKKGPRKVLTCPQLRIGRSVLRERADNWVQVPLQDCNYIGAFVIERDMDEDAEK